MADQDSGFGDDEEFRDARRGAEGNAERLRNPRGGALHFNLEDSQVGASLDEREQAHVPGRELHDRDVRLIAIHDDEARTRHLDVLEDPRAGLRDQRAHRREDGRTDLALDVARYGQSISVGDHGAADPGRLPTELAQDFPELSFDTFVREIGEGGLSSRLTSLHPVPSRTVPGSRPSRGAPSALYSTSSRGGIACLSAAGR